MPEYIFDEPVAVIGDIHGCAELLEKLLPLVGDRPILCLGDVGDRGPDTKRVLDILIEREAKGVLGNHDLWLRDLATKGIFDRIALSSVVGGLPTLVSYGFTRGEPKHIEAQASLIPREHAQWLESLPLIAGLTVLGEKFWLSHVGVPRLSGMNTLRPEELIPFLLTLGEEGVLWSFEDPRVMRPADRPVIMGHRAFNEGLDLKHVICVDTGAGKGGSLSALLLPEKVFVTVK